MGVLSENEFKDAALPSQEKLRKLLTLALYGNDSFHSVFTAMADQAGTSPRGREDREKRQEHYAMLRRMMMASQEQVAEFQRKLDRLERQTYDAMLEAEENLRKAREEEKRVMDRAHKVTTEDGRIIRVYRDGDKVRDDDGNLVSRDIIKAEDMPEETSSWDERHDTRARSREAVLGRDETVSNYARVGVAKEALHNTGGIMSKDEFQELKASVEPIESGVEDMRNGAEHALTPPHQGALLPGPT